VERVRDLLSTDEGGGARSLGGLLLATGVLVLLIRRTELADPWGDGLVFWILLATAAFLYATGFLGARLSPTGYAWQRAFMVFGLVLIPFAGFAFLQWIDGNADAPLNSAWIFGLTAAAAFAAALVAGLRFGSLLAGISLIIVWLAVWDELLDDGIGGDIGTLRGLLIVIGLILLALAAAVAVRGRPEGAGSDLVTAGGIAVVWAAGVVTLSALTASITPFATEAAVDTNLLWDLVLLVAALALIGYAAVSGFRGPGYVGAVGLGLFIYIVGFDLDDSSPAGKVVGWPLILLLVAAALIVISVLPALRRTPD
jgi:hypothetical protein